MIFLKIRNSAKPYMALNFLLKVLRHVFVFKPFPRREFTKEEMSNTLKFLGLVPSGSLVLKKKDVHQATGIVLQI